MEFRGIKREDDEVLAHIIRSNLKAYGLDMPGTAYYDDNLNHLSDYYLKDKDKRFYYVVLEDEKVIGGIGLDEINLFDNCAELQKLYLTDSAKGRGIGYRLIEKIEDKARSLGYTQMYLETHTNLEAAIHIYEKTGYTEIPKPSLAVHSAMNKFFIKKL
ncbi:MAG: GNAT family N-acetyltransferase [Lachnospiraceae bacterium]|nr:GNAT family N-acetyltransferase [Lachnospiraceae bacterium]